MGLVSGCRNHVAVLLGVKSVVSMSSESNVSCVKHKERVGGLFPPRGQFVFSGRMVNKHYHSDILQDQKKQVHDNVDNHTCV